MQISSLKKKKAAKVHFFSQFAKIKENIQNDQKTISTTKKHNRQPENINHKTCIYNIYTVFLQRHNCLPLKR